MAANPIAAEDFEVAMAKLLSSVEPFTSKSKQFSDADIDGIAKLLARRGKPQWSLRPRTFAVLRFVNRVDVMDEFVSDGLFDIAFPYTLRRIPSAIANPTTRHKFLQVQQVVLTKATDLKNGGRHRHLGTPEDVDAHFETLRRLGQGGFGVVDHVRSKLSQEEYARKRVYRSSAFGKDKDAIQMFENELSNLKRLKHDHLVQFVSSYTDSRYIGLLISPVADCDLKDFLTRDPFPEADLILLREFIGCLCSAVLYLHENKCRHKDLKPSNILIKGQSVLLTDFGLARDFSDRAKSTTVGRSGPYTPGYASPEVAASEPRNTSSDIWSLGCVYLDIATVLKGETLRKRATFFESTGTGGLNPCRNQNALQEWLTYLKSDVDNQPLEWIRLMVREDPIRRITASVLLEKILDYYNPDSGHSYYGPCCFGEESEADSQSYKGSLFAEENEEREEEEDREVGEGTDKKDSDNTSHKIGSSSPEDRPDKTLVSRQHAAESGATVLSTEATNVVGMMGSKGSDMPKDVEMSSQAPANNILKDSSTSSNTLPVTIWSEQRDAALPIRRSNSISAGKYRKDSRDVGAGFIDAVELEAPEIQPYWLRDQSGIEQTAGEEDVSEPSSSEDTSRPKSPTRQNIISIVETMRGSPNTSWIGRPPLPSLLPRFSFDEDESSAIMRHSQTTTPNADSEIPSIATPKNLKQMRTESRGSKIPQDSSAESFGEPSGSNLGTRETSPPSKRNLTFWWKISKKNTKKEEKKGILASLLAASAA